MSKRFVMLAVIFVVMLAAASVALAYGVIEVTFDEGGLAFEGQSPNAHTHISVWCVNDQYDRPQRGFMRIGNSGGPFLARTNGAGDDAKFTQALSYENPAYTDVVPFCIGEHYKGTRIYTPRFNSGSVKLFNSAQFFAAVDGTASVTTSEGVFTAEQEGARVRLYRNGTLIARTNGAGDNGTLIELAVLRTRTSFTLDANGKVVNSYSDVPFVVVSHYNKGLQVLTPKYNAGSVKLFDYVGSLQ